MSLYIRLWVILLFACLRDRLHHQTDESVVTLRVWPNDLDLAGHVNNGRYATIMDLGRLDLLVRRGLLRHMIRLRWQPRVASTLIRFRRSLGPFVRYHLHTRLLCWDDKWFFFEQRFERGGELYAHALVKTVIKSPTGTVRPADVFALLGADPVSPPPPASVTAWMELERSSVTERP